MTRTDRIRIRFSIRTLMIGVTVFALLLMFTVTLFRKERTLSIIERRIGSVSLEDGPSWKSRIIGKRLAGRVVSIGGETYECDLSEQQVVALLRNFRHLRTLSLYWAQ